MTTNKSLSNEAADKVLSGITIPPCPASLTSILREAKHPSADFNSLARLISRDAGIVGPLLKLANSPFVGLRSKVTSVLQAISVLGIQNTVNLVQNISLRQSLGGGAPTFEKFWERSSLSASIAEKVAAKLPSMSKDDAYLVALFHDCGIPVLMMKFPDYRETVMSQSQLGKSICDIENDVFSTSHTVVGHMMTRSWMLPAHISQAILHHHDATIFKPSSGLVDSNVCSLIAILHMAECITDEHLLAREKEWPIFEHDVLNHFELSAQDFIEIKGDILALLNEE
ncbi:MAG: HDOD domain-containing protein [Gallionellaceae bacterium]